MGDNLGVEVFAGPDRKPIAAHRRKQWRQIRVVFLIPTCIPTMLRAAALVAPRTASATKDSRSTGEKMHKQMYASTRLGECMASMGAERRAGGRVPKHAEGDLMGPLLLDRIVAVVEGLAGTRAQGSMRESQAGLPRRI